MSKGLENIGYGQYCESKVGIGFLDVNKEADYGNRAKLGNKKSCLIFLYRQPFSKKSFATTLAKQEITGFCNLMIVSGLNVFQKRVNVCEPGN